MGSVNGQGGKLTFSVLTQRVPGPRPGSVLWIARSTTTGHVGHGDTEDASIERLFAGIVALVNAAAERDGFAPDRWFDDNQLAEPHFVHEFERLERSGSVETLPSISGPAGLRMELRKAQQPALD